jgi:hypothetical protein
MHIYYVRGSKPMQSTKSLEKAKGREVGTGKDIVLVKSQPLQLSLFQTFFPDDETHHYSNTIELYDAVPKYFASTKQMAERRVGGQFLPSLKRDFKHRGQSYTVEILPGRVRDKDGVEREYYPSQREELVEEALKKIASDRLNGIFLNDVAGVQFTLYELRQELEKQHHGMPLRDLITSLEICRRAGLKISSRDGKNVLLDSSIFPVLVLVSRHEWEDDPKNTRCYVQFNPLVTSSMKKLAYRQFHYVKFMQFKRQLTRWLFKRMSHNYTQASIMEPYRITQSTIERDSALINSAQLRDRVRYVCDALDELRDPPQHANAPDDPQACPVLLDYKKETLRGKRNKIEDVKYTLTPHPDFVARMKKANKRRQLIAQDGIQNGLITNEEYMRQESLWHPKNV